MKQPAFNAESQKSAAVPPAPPAQPKPDAKDRVIGALEMQRNEALSRLAVMTAELGATHDALTEAQAKNEALTKELADCQSTIVHVDTK